MSFDLQLGGKRALVTGGTKGVGAATVAMLSRAGARVAAAARSQPTRASDGVAYLAAALSTEDGARAVAEAVLERFGGIDILVNVVGGSSSPSGGFAALDDKHWSTEMPPS